MKSSQAQPKSARAAATKLLRELPSVDRLISSNEAEGLTEQYGRQLAVEAVRRSLEESRKSILAGDQVGSTERTILDRAEQFLLQNIQPTMRSVINATGVIVHTNLGRALLSQASVEAVAEISRNYSNLEYDLSAGSRGSRSLHAERLLRQLTGAEAAHTVNNNAAAVLLMLSALCLGREVIISRGQLIEIGGGFRVPDVMAQSGARLVEVGTTNRTHIGDYLKAINEETAAIFVAHHSNFRIVGFTSEPGLEELAEVAHSHNLVMLYDQGSGAVRDTAQFGLDREITVQEALFAGADVVAFSGDKLLGGPQAGILCGKEHLIDAVKRHPLSRAVRADKMCLAALSETLRAHLVERADYEIPVWRMISAKPDELRERAERWKLQLDDAQIRSTLIEGFSTVGGGSLPGSVLPTWLLALELDNVDAVAEDLRTAETPVIGRIADDKLLFDPRTVLVEQDESMVKEIIGAAVVRKALNRESGG